MKKTAAFILAAALVLLSGCSKTQAHLTIDGKPANPAWIVKIDGQEIDLDEYRYYFLNCKSYYDLEEWTAEDQAELKDQTLEYLLVNYGINKFAAEKGISLDEDDLKQADEEIASAVESAGGKDEYAELLSSNNMTQALYRKLVETSILQTKLNTELFTGEGEYALTQEEMRSKLENEYIRVRYLMLYSGEGQEELAGTLLERIRAGEDFVELVNKYGEESTMNGNPDGLYFREGMTESGFYQTAAALDIEEISEIYQGEDGFYIIKRLPLDADYIDQYIDKFIQQELQTVFTDVVGRVVDSLKVEYCDIYDKIDTDTLK